MGEGRTFLPVFYTVNFDGVVKYERGDNGEPIPAEHIEDLGIVREVVLPIDKKEHITLNDEYHNRTEILLFDSFAKSRRGESHLASEASLSPHSSG